MTTRQQALQAAKAQIARDLAHYDYPSQNEIEYALLQMKLLNLKQAASTVNAVINKFTPSTTQKKSCGCTGKSGSAGYQTKSMSNGSRQSRNYFAKEYERLVCATNDERYAAFCRRFDSSL